MAKIKWTNGSGGEWFNGANWSGGTVPGANDKVVIAAAPAGGIPYIVDLNGNATVKALTLDQPAATLLVDNAVLTAPIALEAGTLGLDSGTLTGVVADTGGVLELSSSYYGGYAEGTLLNVTWQGNLMPLLNTAEAYYGSLSVAGGLTLTGAEGKGPGTLTLDQAAVAINFVDTQMLDNATVYLGVSTQGQYASLTTSTDGNDAADLTFGAHLALDVAGGADISDGGEITNNGTISTTGSTDLTIYDDAYNSCTFTNAGTMLIGNAAYAAMEATTFDNTGSLTIASGGTLELAFSTYGGLSVFQNTGNVLDNGTVLLGAGYNVPQFTTSELQGFDINYGAGGTLALSSQGTLDNTGANLVLGSDGIAPTFQLDSYATILGGTLTQNGGTISSGSGTLNGVVVDGSLSLTGAYNTLSIIGGLQMQAGATLSVTGYGDAIVFNGSETLDQTVLVLGSSGGDTLAATGGTLTLDSTVMAEVNSGSAVLAGYYSTDAIINDGNIGVIAGGLLEVGEPYGAIFTNKGTISASGGSTLYLNGTITNTGVVTVQNSTLLVGSVDAALLNTVTLSNSTVGIVGFLTATGSTIDVGTGTELGDVVIGLSQPFGGGSYAGVVGGTIHDSGGGLTVEGNVSFTDVTYQGLLSVAAAYARVTVSDLTLENGKGTGAGTLALSGAQSVLVVAEGTTLDNATIDIGSAINHLGKTTLAAPTIEADGVGGPPILGANLVIDQTAKYAGVGEPDGYSSTVSDATINAAFQGGQMLLDGATFISAGALNIGAQEVLTSAAGSFTNDGAVSIAAGGTLSLNLLNYYQLLPDSGTSFENAGQITLTGGTISEQSGKGIPPVPLRNDAAGSISGTGIVAAEVTNYGTVTATGGELTLSQAVSGYGGVLEVGGSATLSLLSSVSAGETAVFGGTDGVLGLAAKSFLGEIGGFASGDTIDLLKLQATSAEFSGSSIMVTLTQGGTISLTTTEPLSGDLTVTSDGHGGSLIGFADALHLAALVPVVMPQATGGWMQDEARYEFLSNVMHHFGM